MKNINLQSAWNIALNTVCDTPFALAGATCGGLALGMGVGAGVLGTLGQVTSHVTDIPQFVTYAVNTGMYGLGTVGAFFGAAVANNGTARDAANMIVRGFNPTSTELMEHEIAENISTVAAALAVPTTFYYSDLANTII